jgi:hypothetical protein
MKAVSCVVLFLLLMAGNGLSAQHNKYSERYGHTLNIGMGIGGYSGYYGYVGRSVPVFNINYEFDVAPQFTLAPFGTYYTYRDRDYRETVIPLGVKGTYYFDRLLNAYPKWDFYLAGSLGFALITSSWDDGYYGDRGYYQDANALFLDIHVGTEYHINKVFGVFVDISSGVSTIGLAIH